ncbi:hypothetical protein ACLKA7_008804 [Drosophila subpalustris]
MNFLGDFGGISGSVRRRHHPRGTKRGRPRGSTRRGGGHGSVQRVSTPTTSPAVGMGTGMSLTAATGTGTTTTALLPQQEGTGGNIEAASGPSMAVPQHDEDSPTIYPALASPMATPPTSLVKRGPGRPRSKTATPVSRGTRGAPRARRPMGPLLVPLGRSPDATPPGSSPATSRAPSPLAHGILD